MNKILSIFLLFNYNKTESDFIEMTNEVKVSNAYNYGDYSDLNKYEYDLLVSLDKKSQLVLICYGLSSFINLSSFGKELNNKVILPSLPHLMMFLTNSLLVFYKSYSIKMDLIFSFVTELMICYVYNGCTNIIKRKDGSEYESSIVSNCSGLLIVTKVFMYAFIYRKNKERQEKINTLLSMNPEKFKNLV